MDNWTFVEEDPLSSIDFNFNESISLDDEYAYEMPLHSLIYEYILLIANFAVLLCSIGSCIFYFYIFVKFKALRTRPNILILNYLISTLISISFVPIIDILMLVLDKLNFWFYELYCIEYTLQDCGFCFTYIFAFWLLVNFFIMSHHKNLLEPHQNLIDKFLTFGIYGLGILTAIFAVTTSCFGSFFHLSHHMFPFIFGIIAIATIILDCIHFVKSKRLFTDSDCNQGGKRYEFIIANLIILSWIPFPLSHLIVVLFEASLYFFFIIRIFFNLLETFVQGLPILILYLLGRYNKYFKMSFDLTCKRRLRGYRGGTDEDVDQILSENNFEEFCNRSSQNAQKTAPDVENVEAVY